MGYVQRKHKTVLWCQTSVQRWS